jgi:hypothetical protein
LEAEYGDLSKASEFLIDEIDKFKTDAQSQVKEHQQKTNKEIQFLQEEMMRYKTQLRKMRTSHTAEIEITRINAFEEAEKQFKLREQALRAEFRDEKDELYNDLRRASEYGTIADRKVFQQLMKMLVFP